MKNKKLAILALALGLIGTIGFASCGGDNGSGGATSSGNSSGSHESSSPVGGDNEEVQGEVFADEAAWRKALQDTMAETNAVITFATRMEERVGEFFMRDTGAGTMQLADGKMYYEMTGTSSSYYEENGEIVSSDEAFTSERYIAEVDGVAVVYYSVNGDTWRGYPYEEDYGDAEFSATTGCMLRDMNVYLDMFADMFAVFENVGDTYVYEERDAEQGGTAVLKFVNGKLYSYVMESEYIYEVGDGMTMTEIMEMSMEFSYGNASVGELPDAEIVPGGGGGGSGGEDGPDKPSKPDEPEDCPHSFSEYYSNYDATCTEDGTKTAWCDYGCGETETVVDEGSKLGHSFTYYVSNDDATCEEDGTKTASCENGCGETETVADEGSKLGHSFIEYVSNGDATCEEDGTKTASCENGCGETETVMDEGTGGHRFTQYESNDDATCTEDGTKTATCDNDCGETKTVTDEGTAKGHSFTDYKTDDSGKQTATCDNGCGETDVKGEAVQDEAAWRKAIADSIGKTNATVGYVSKLSAEDEYGSYLEQVGTATAKLANKTLYELVTGTTVTNITDSYTESFMTETYVGYVDNLAMQWYRESAESAWECYPFNVDGAEFTGTLGEFMTMRSIPIAYFADMFAAFTYDNGTYVYEVDITDDGEVGRIEIKFLNGLLYSYEQTVTVRESVDGIDGDGVAYMNFIISYDDASGIELPPMTWERPASEGLQFTLNSDKKSYTVTGLGSCQDTYIVIPETYENYPVTGIGDRAFANCSATDIVIPDSVTSIDSAAFFNCSSLEEIVIPDSVKSIGRQAFDYCTALTKVHIRDTIAWYKTSFKDGANPLSYAKNLYINNVPVTRLVIPDGERAITTSAFANCSSLTEIVIPASVTSISKDVFANCTNLTDVYITDVVAWKNISGISNITRIGAKDKNLHVNDELVTKLIIPEGVTGIANDAFASFVNLTEIVIPDSVTSIGVSAFYACDNLTRVTFGENSQLTSIGSSAFSNCASLTEIVIPESVTSIGSYAFNYCTSLTEIVIPESVTSIGNNAFYNCSSLAEIVIPDSVTTLGSSAFGNCIGLMRAVIGSGITAIGSSVFSACSNLTEIVIPESVTSIGNNAFYNCSNLTDVYITDVAAWNNISNLSYLTMSSTSNKNLYIDGVLVTKLIIPDGVESISNRAFYNFSNLTEIVVPDSVMSIGDEAFYSCDGLTNVTFAENSQLTSIGKSAFYYCTALTEIAIPDSVTSIGASAFDGCIGLTEIVLLDSVTTVGYGAFSRCSPKSVTCSIEAIGYFSKYQMEKVVFISGENINNNMFYNCKNLTEVVIPDTVTSIGHNAFDMCDNLTSVTFGENSQLTSIGDYAFRDCFSLLGISIPDTVTSIGEGAFRFCSSLTEISIPDSVTSIGASTFSGCNGLKYNEADGLKYLGNEGNPYLYLVGYTTLPSVVVTIKDGCKWIGGNVLYGASTMEIIIPDSVTSIGKQAFYCCKNLTEIIIPIGVTNIGDEAFSGCNYLRTITFSGTVEQWNEIAKGNNWHSYVPATTVVCSDDEVAL